MDIWKSIILGIIEGVSEFLPISSTGHLTITEKILGLPIDDKGITAYTAIIQVGATFAAVIYFFKDLVQFVKGFFVGVRSAEGRQTEDWRKAITVIIGCIPIGIAGIALKPLIEGPLRSLWFVAGGLVVWSIVMVFAEHLGKQNRGWKDVTWKDGLIVGLFQSLAFIPGVSRSGATISTGLLRGIDRVTATRLSFFLGIPALTAAGVLEAATAVNDISSTVGWPAVAVGTVVSFVVGYASIAWLLRFVSSNSLIAFVWYRVALGGILVGLLATNAMTAT